MLHIEYTTRDVYGIPTRYPHNSDARLVCALAHTKTITDTMRATVLAFGGTATEVHH
jgi:hypothetical protein